MKDLVINNDDFQWENGDLVFTENKSEIYTQAILMYFMTQIGSYAYNTEWGIDIEHMMRIRDKILLQYFINNSFSYFMTQRFINKITVQDLTWKFPNNLMNIVLLVEIPISSLDNQTSITRMLNIHI